MQKDFIVRDLLKLDFESFKINLEEFVNVVINFYDYPKNKGDQVSKVKLESFYQILLCGVFACLSEDYRMLSNPSYGKGRPDMVLVSRLNKEALAFVFELKRGHRNKGDLSKKALNQIEKMSYAKTLRSALGDDHKGAIYLIGLAFYDDRSIDITHDCLDHNVDSQNMEP